MLIKNEINVEGIAGQQIYGSEIMIIFYILSLFGCIFIIVLLLKFIISCFFSDTCFQFCKRINNDGINGDLEEVKAISSSQNGISQTVAELENIFLKLSQAQLTFNEKYPCICPICANTHQCMKSLRTSLTIDHDSDIENKIQSSVGFYEDKNNNSLQQEVVSRLVIPIVAQSQSLRSTDSNTENYDKMEKYASYSDVVLELKRKFSSTDDINSVMN